MANEIDKHMLRERANKLPDITEVEWKQVNKETRDLVEEYLSISKQLSPDTLTQYTSGLKVFFWWVRENLENKTFHNTLKLFDRIK